MKAPSITDRFVRVVAYLSDEGFGYDNWHARQFSAPNLDRYGVLNLCADAQEQAEALAYLEWRAKETA